MPAFGVAVTKIRPAARLERDIMLEVALGGGPSAYRAGAGGMPDLSQVPELYSGVMSLGLELVVAVVGVQGVQLHDQVRAGSGGAQPPGPQPTRRPILVFAGEAEPGPWPVPAPGGAGRPRP